MPYREFSIVLVVLLFAVCPFACAQQPREETVVDRQFVGDHVFVTMKRDYGQPFGDFLYVLQISTISDPLDVRDIFVGPTVKKPPVYRALDSIIYCADFFSEGSMSFKSPIIVFRVDVDNRPLNVGEVMLPRSKLTDKITFPGDTMTVDAYRFLTTPEHVACEIYRESSPTIKRWAYFLGVKEIKIEGGRCSTFINVTWSDESHTRFAVLHWTEPWGGIDITIGTKQGVDCK